MDPQTDKELSREQGAEADQNRRELIRKLGRFAVYATPFTVLAFSEKAHAASGGGPRPLARPH